jgi:hypothetical protein
MRETGLLLGSLLLETHEWDVLRSAPVLSLRTDDHRVRDGWTVTNRDGARSTVSFEIPVGPVTVPAPVLAHGRALEEWAMWVHGGSGRLLLWDQARRWWMVQEPELELAIVCGPRDDFGPESEVRSWLPTTQVASRRETEQLCARYGLTWSE